MDEGISGGASLGGVTWFTSDDGKVWHPARCRMIDRPWQSIDPVVTNFAYDHATQRWLPISGDDQEMGRGL